MRPHNPRKRRRLIPSLHPLETRRLLSLSVVSAGQDGQDFVGPDAAPGSDGNVDLHLELSGLLSGLSSSSFIQEIEVTSQTPQGVPLAWETAGIPGDGSATADPDGFAQAAFFYTVQPDLSSPQVAITSTGDLYIDPEVNSVAAQPAGAGTPVSLGGSTGPLEPLENGDYLDITVTYVNGEVDSCQLQLENLTSAIDAMPTTPTPSPVDFWPASTSLQVNGQDDTALSAGWVHVTLTAPSSSGVSFNPSDFTGDQTQNGLYFELTDDFGNEWDSSIVQAGHNIIDASLESGTTNTVNLYFPPVADEAPVNGSTSPNMTLQIIMPDSSNVYAVEFAGQDWNLSLIDQAPTDSSATASCGAQIQDDINDDIGTIYLPAGQTIYSSEPIQITNSVTIMGQGATVEFDQNGDIWPSTADGAIYVIAPGGTHLQITLEDFTIDFACTPLAWSNPPNSSPALYDPENNVAGMQLAVINDSSAATNTNDNRNTDTINLEGMTIYGPPAWDAGTDGSNFLALQQELQTPTADGGVGDNDIHTYIGEPAIFLLDTNSTDNGTITGCTFEGGSLYLYHGPWIVTNNRVLGATAYTYSLSAFSMEGVNGSLVEGNTVEQSIPCGTELRFINFAGGYYNTVEDNNAGNGAGMAQMPVTFDDSPSEPLADAFYTGDDSPLNAPEFMLMEPAYSTAFEGNTEAVSSDGYLLKLPDVRMPLSAFGSGALYGPGYIVSIVSGPDAGEWFPVAQEVSADGSTLELLMEDPLPQFPGGQPYTIEITAGNFVGDSFIGNTINLTGKISTGLIAGGCAFGLRVIGNDFIGGSSVDGSYTGTAIAIGSSFGPNEGTGGEYGMPANWTEQPDFGTVVEGNVIENAIDGIEVDDGGPAPSTGLEYLTVTIVDNTFEWTASFLSMWFAEYSDGYDGTDAQEPNNPGNDPNDPAANQYPPTITVGSGFSSVGWHETSGYRTPQTVGGYNDAYQSTGFVDPSETVLTIQNNPTELINSDGSVTPEGPDTGQIYNGTVNGTEYAPVLTPGSFNGFPYYLFNYLNLNTVDGDVNTQGLQAVAIGQDNYDMVGAGSGSPEPDGFQDLHFELTGLSTTDPISSITVTDGADGEQWVYPESGSYPQIVFDDEAGSTTADIFIQPSAPVFDGTFTIDVAYSSGGPIAIPVNGVTFDPYLPVDPSVPQAPVDLSVPADSLTSSGLSLSWAAVAGADSYEVQDAPASDPTAWSIVAAVTSTEYGVTGLSSSTAYDFRVVAVSSSLNLNGIAYSDYSPASAVLSATTLPSDVLTMTAVSWSTTSGYAWTGTVAIFSDDDESTEYGEFTATVNWGDGTGNQPASVYGGDGYFTVSAGPHTYTSAGDYNVQVQAELVSASISASTESEVTVMPNTGQPSLPYNEIGITTSGTGTGGQLDSFEQSYSSSSLGDAVTWGSNSFYIAPANTDDVVAAAGQTVCLSGSGYTSIEILGTATGGVYQTGEFTVNYSGGTSLNYTLGFSDWNEGYIGPGTNAPGESTVLTLSYFNNYSGGTERTTTTSAYLYGYVIPVNPAGTLVSLVLPTDLNIKILSLDLVTQPPQVNMAAPGSSLGTSTSFNDYGITSDGVGITSSGGALVGLGGTDATFSGEQLGTTVTWDGQSFNVGAANTPDVYAVNGWPIYLPQNDYTNLLILGTAVDGVQSVDITVVYANNTQVTYHQDFSDWISGYTGAGTTAPGESIVESMPYYSNTDGERVNQTVYLYGYNFSLNPDEPVSYVYFDNNINQSILAVDVVNEPSQIDMAAPCSSLGTNTSFNGVGITLDCESKEFDGPTDGPSGGAGGINGSEDSYSANLLGNTLTWDGQTFDMGGADTDDVYEVNGWPIFLPRASYTNLLILGAAFGVQTAQITVTYTDGTQVTFDQDFSSWTTGYTGTGGTTAPGESIVDSMPYHDDASGKVCTTVYVYGYNLPLDPSKTVDYVSFDNNTNRFILAVDVVNQPSQVNLSAPGSSGGAPESFNGVGISVDGESAFAAGLNNGGNSYSANLLGTTLAWDGLTFDIGPAGAPDVSFVNGSSIQLPEVGAYTDLVLLGASEGAGTAEITVTYSVKHRRTGPIILVRDSGKPVRPKWG